mgnify:CR=1 FL=1
MVEMEEREWTAGRRKRSIVDFDGPIVERDEQVEKSAWSECWTTMLA